MKDINNPDINALMAQFVQLDASDAKHGSLPSNVTYIRPKVADVPDEDDTPDIDLSAMSEDILALRSNLLALCGDAGIPASTSLKLKATLQDLNKLHDQVLNHLASSISNLSSRIDQLGT